MLKQWSLKRRSGTIWTLLGFLRPFAGQAALSVLVGAATIASSIALLGASAYLIAYAALRPSIAVLQVTIVGVRFFGISRALLRYLERLISHAVNFNVLAELRVWFYNRLEPLAPARLQHVHSADLLSRAIADIETLENFYVRAVSPPLVAVLVVAGVSIFAASYDPLLGLFLASALLAAGLVLPVFVHRLARAPGEAFVERRARLNALLVDTIQGMPDLLAFGRAADQAGRIHAAGQGLNRSQARLTAAGALGNALGILAAGLALWGMLYLAIPMVGVAHSGFDGIALAVLVLVTLASFEAVTPLTLATQHFSSSMQAARRLFSLVAQPPAVLPVPEPAEFPAGAFDLCIHGLTFAYPAEETGALVDFNLDLPAGKRVALVGPSGAGKTTLFNLLMRFWEFEQGSIEVGGQDIHAYALEDLRARMALISQNTYLFAGTLRQNLLLANPGAPQAALDRAIQQAQLAGLVAQLPHGLDTWVGEHGLQLSGGERQRLAVARALLREAPLLLLDEPTANLDAVTEQSLLMDLKQASAGRSVLAITHSLAGLQDYDEILVLSAGHVIERGDHAALLAAGGVYAQMWQIRSESLA